MDPTVSERVKSEDVEIRRKVALDLADLPATESLPHLGLLVGDPNWRVRKATVEAILSHPIPQILPILLEALYDDDNAGRRNSAVETLIKIGPEALPRIYEHLIEEHVDVKLALINLLGEIPSRQSAPHLIYYLNHENKNLVSAAISSLGMLKDPANLNVLIDLLRRADPWIWFHLIDAFAEIGGPFALDRLTEIYDTPRFRKAVLKAFGKMGSLQVVPFLLDRLEDPGTPILEVMATLGRLYHANIPEALLARHRTDMADMTRENFPIQSVERLHALWPEAKIPERRGMILVAGYLSELSLLEHVLNDLDNPYLQGDAFQAVQGYGGAAVSSAIDRLRALPPIENRIHLIKILALSGSSEAVAPLTVLWLSIRNL